MRRVHIFLTLALFLLSHPEARAADLVEPTTMMEFVLVKGGEYQRGDETGLGRGNERPVQSVRVADFYMGAREVTVGQFARFVEDTGHLTAPEKRGWVLDIDPAMGSFSRKEGISWSKPGFEQGEDHPVVWVDWHDAMAFAAWVSGKTGRRYSLPTEAQWEYAARAGGSSRWSGTSSEADLPGFAWFSSNSGGVTHATGTRKPNNLGIYDMSGNVWEWCLDGYSDYGKAPHTLEDPMVRTGDTRIIRGGSWRVDAALVTTSYRNGYRPTYSHSSMGFRLVRKGGE